MFANRYIKSVSSSDLRDDAHHHDTDALAASALSDMGSGGVLGSLLCRVKYSDGAIHKDLESGSGNLAQLLREWSEVVRERGRSRGWVKIRAEWDIATAESLYATVARASLAHWMSGLCEECSGAKVTKDRRNCPCCAGTGKAKIDGPNFVVDRVKDMVSELEGIFQAHSGRASAMLRRVA